MAVDIEIKSELVSYLTRRGQIEAGETPGHKILTGGVSNRCIWLERETGEAWVIKQALQKLRVEADWFSDPERIQNEAQGIRWLKELVPQGAIPDLIFEDKTENILAMSAVPQPHENWKVMLLNGDIRDAHTQQFARMLGAIHTGSHRQREEYQRVFGDRRYFESLRIEPYYLYTARRRPETARFFEDLVTETRANRLALVHGDYSPKNILVYDGRLTLLDHEVIHFGDPAFDIGFALTHLLSKARHVSQARERFAEAGRLFWQIYRDCDPAVVDPYEARAVKHTLACLLARVDGRSPLEYLTPHEQDAQRQQVTRLMSHAPLRIPDLIDSFAKGL